MRNHVKILTISLLMVLSFLSILSGSAYTSNTPVYAKESASQDLTSPWNLTITYTVKNNVFTVNTSLTFLHNITLLFYSSPAFNYWIYNSSNQEVFALNPSSTSYINKTFIGNQSIDSSASVPLASTIIPSSGNYSISINLIPVNKVVDNFFSAVVSNSSVNLTFQRNEITTSGTYAYPTTTPSSTSATTTKKSNALGLSWFFAVCIPIMFVSLKRRR